MHWATLIFPVVALASTPEFRVERQPVAHGAELLKRTREELLNSEMCSLFPENRTNGKLQKYKLRQPYWEGREKQVN